EPCRYVTAELIRPQPVLRRWGAEPHGDVRGERIGRHHEPAQERDDDPEGDDGGARPREPRPDEELPEQPGRTAMSALLSHQPWVGAGTDVARKSAGLWDGGLGTGRRHPGTSAGQAGRALQDGAHAFPLIGA